MAASETGDGGGRSLEGRGLSGRCADYDVEAEFSTEDANAACEQARAFLDRIESYLLANDMTADDLGPEANPPA